MKKLLVTSLCVLATSAALAGPVDPMDYYTPDNVDQETADHIWNNMTDDLRGKHCFMRAQVWAVGMRDLKRQQVKSKKIFIHYTDKFNKILDEISDERKLWGSFRIKGSDGKRVLNRSEQQLYKKNVTWDYHVAPVIEVEGRDVVLDKTLKLPYDMPMPYVSTPDFKLEQTVRQSTPEEWLEALTHRGEMLWNIKKKVIEAQIPKLYKKANKARERETQLEYIEDIETLKKEYAELDMANQETIDIKCTKVTSMAEVDANQENAWCFYSIVPMYYYTEIDLRQVAYGRAQHDFRWAVPVEENNAVNNEVGKEFIRTSFNNKNLRTSLGEITNDETKARYRALYEYIKKRDKK